MARSGPYTYAHVQNQSEGSKHRALPCCSGNKTQSVSKQRKQRTKTLEFPASSTKRASLQGAEPVGTT